MIASIVRRFELNNSFDVVQARQCAREMARDLGFGLTDQTRIATAVSEVAHRALTDGNCGSVRFAIVSRGPRRGLECTCLGGSALQKPTNLISGGVLGGVERLVDEFAVRPGDGEEEVTVVMRKWLHEETLVEGNQGAGALGVALRPT